MIGVSEFCKQLFMLTEYYAQLHRFGGVKSVALTFYLMPQTVANVLLDGQFWKNQLPF